MCKFMHKSFLPPPAKRQEEKWEQARRMPGVRNREKFDLLEPYINLVIFLHCAATLLLVEGEENSKNHFTPSSLLHTFTFKIEETLPSDNEELSDFPSSLLSPKREDLPLSTSGCFSVPCKLEPETEDLRSPFLDNEDMMNSTVCSSGGVNQRFTRTQRAHRKPELSGPNMIVSVKNLTENTFEEQTTGVGIEILCPRTYQRVHTRGKRYKCEVCEKTFSRSGNLNKHKRLHTGEKPFKCGVCKKGFYESGNLKRHERIHIEEKPYKCNVCKKFFSQSSHLKMHQKGHKGEKPFKCDVCDKCFS
ncbi:zinc finger protein 112-like [Artemia franciscana]|uniref:zinc finger protein 112-like n=1 Tax=Artemia franciscana TaxID=6661 RepID=UPI0032D9CA8D